MEQIEKLLDEINFKRIRKVMKALDWRYFDSDDYPTVERLRAGAKYLAICAYNRVKSGEHKRYLVATGGFRVSAEKHKKSEEIFLSIIFAVEDVNNDI